MNRYRLVNNTISINKTLSYGLSNRLIVDSLKTKQSKSTVHLSPNLKQVLLNYQAEPKIISDKIFHTIRGIIYHCHNLFSGSIKFMKKIMKLTKKTLKNLNLMKITFKIKT